MLECHSFLQAQLKLYRQIVSVYKSCWPGFFWSVVQFVSALASHSEEWLEKRSGQARQNPDPLPDSAREQAKDFRVLADRHRSLFDAGATNAERAPESRTAT